jgi:uncharacterized protein (TIGR02246 family)
MRKLLFLVAALGLFVRAAPAAWAQGAAGTPPDEKAMAERSKSLIDAFNRGDAKALAEFWTPDGDYMDELGQLYKGRKAIEDSFVKLFAAGKGAKLHVYRTSLRFVRPDLAIGDGLFEVAPPNGAPPTAARYTSVQVLQDGKWLIASLREAVATPPNSAGKLEDMAWLVGGWAEDSDKGPSARASFTWAEGHNFLVNRFVMTVKDVPMAGGTQWIAHDAAAKQIRSWMFDSSGAIGEGAWTRDGDRLVGKIVTTLTDGKKVSSTTILTRVDANHATWQSIQRSMDGQALPDTPPMKIKRVE